MQTTKTISDALKEYLERGVVHDFLLAYNRAIGSAFRISRMGVPPEPDVLCKDAGTGQEIGVEVVTAYNEKEHAKAVWETARGKETLPYPQTRLDSKENIRILAEAVRSLRAKSKKSYRVSSRPLLVVFIFSWRPYLCTYGVKKRLPTLRVPQSHPFDEIHIMSQYGEVYSLFPEYGWILR